MSAATDFVHDEDVVDAVIAQLYRELPAQWTGEGNSLWRLKSLQFGDLRDFRYAAGDSPRSLCPLILVRVNRSQSAPSYGGLGGKAAQVVPVRLLYVCTRDHCRDLTDPTQRISPARARAQVAKVLSKALFANRDLGQPLLSTQDTAARVLELRPQAVLYETEPGEIELARQWDLIAVALDCEVLVRTQ